MFGLGGVGKSQIALELAYRVKEQWPEFSIFWVPAVSAESFELAYRDIATRCSITLDPKEEDPKESVRRYLNSDLAGKWLLIVDNADDEEILFPGSSDSGSVTDYLPQSENGLTLFTTRHREIAVSLARNKIVEVQEMDQEAAQTFLKKSLAEDGLLQDHTVVTELLSELAFLPLAIAQAAAYLNSMQISIPEYLSLLRSTEQDTVSLLSREFHDDTRYKNSRNAVAATWLVSFDRIRRSDAVAADLLSFMSCLENKAIPRSILPSVEPAERTMHAIGTLRAYAFVTRRDDDSYDMHRLVHLATKVWLDGHGVVETLNVKVAAHLAEIFPSRDYANRAIWREYFPHVFQFLRTTRTLDIEARYDLFLAVGSCLQVDGRIAEAVAWLYDCFLWRQGRYSEDHPSRVASQHALACVYLEDGRIKQAVKLLEQIVAIEENTFQEDYLSRMSSQHVLAMAYLADGQIKQAIKLLEQVVAIRENILQKDHPNRLASQHVLAMAYRADGQIKEAVKLLEQVVAIEKNVLQENHPSRLGSQHGLACAYLNDGQIKQAIKLLEQVIAIREKILQEDHPSRLASQHELAIAYWANGQINQAIKLLEKVVAIKEKVLRQDHPNRLISQDALLGLYAEQRSEEENQTEINAQ